jgi:hypothetical protein
VTMMRTAVRVSDVNFILVFFNNISTSSIGLERMHFPPGYLSLISAFVRSPVTAKPIIDLSLNERIVASNSNSRHVLLNVRMSALRVYLSTGLAAEMKSLRSRPRV